MSDLGGGDPARERSAATILDVWGETLPETAVDPDVTLRTPPPSGPGSTAPATRSGEPDGPAGDGEAPDLARDLVLGERLGEGGMGVVHAARQRSLGRIVAVKSLHDDGAARPALVRAFLDEARITARLEHPNVIPIHALGRGGDGRLLLAMKRVEGRAWSTLISEDPPAAGPAALGRHLAILARVLDALAFAHDQGVLHRDLKPQNVMVGAFGQVYVLDWGLALALGPDGRAPASSPAGTPSYLSPEAAGEGGPLGRASDVYLVGAILHQLLVGRPPHRGASALEVLVAAVKNDVLPLRPSFDAPAALVALAERCLATRPEERFPSAIELRAALEAFLAGDERRRVAEVARREAEARLAALPPPRDAAAAAAQYGPLLEADALVQRALEGWPERARALRAALDERLVRCALAAGDVGLAASFLARARAAGAAPRGLEVEVEARRRELDPAALLALSVAARRARISSGALALGAACVGLSLPGAALLGGRWEELAGETLLLFQLLALACFPAIPLHAALHVAARRLAPRARAAWRAALALSVVALVHLALAWAVTLQATKREGPWWLGAALLVPLGLHVHALAGLLDRRARALADRD